MAIDGKSVAIVEEEAYRILDRCKKWRERMKQDSSMAYTGCRESAALRRASLEMTRALADLRR